MIGGGPLIATGLRYVDPKTGRSAWMEGSQFIAFIRDEVAREAERRKKADKAYGEASAEVFATREHVRALKGEVAEMRAEIAALKADLDQLRDLFVNDAPAQLEAAE